LPGTKTGGTLWGEDVLGGNFSLYSESARLIHGDDGWVVQDGSSVLADLSSLKAALVAVAPLRSVEQADLVLVARLRDVTIETRPCATGEETTYMTLVFEALETLVGEAASGDLRVTQITSGSDWPDWRDASPLRTPRKGRTYCLALREIGSGYAIVNGINGVWEVRDGGLYFAGRSRTKFTINGIRKLGQDRK
jgi:hypothetical protein